MSTNVLTQKERLSDILAKHFVGSEEIENGWKMFFHFPNGTDATLGYAGDEILVETVDSKGEMITWTGIGLPEAEALLSAAVVKGEREGKDA